MKQLLKDAVQLHPFNYEAWFELIDLCAAEGRLAEALQFADALIERDPDCTKAYFFSAELAAIVGQKEKAQGVIARLLRRHDLDAAEQQRIDRLQKQLGSM